MKRFLFLSAMMLMIGVTVAQPPQRRAEQQAQQQAQQRNASSAMSMRAQISFPTAVEMPEEVVWRRDIYREISLEDDANGGLYYPVEPQGRQLNLFTYIFKLALNGYIPVYEYPTDGSDVFSDATKVNMKTILDNYHIFYEEKDGRIKVDNSDIPSAMVKKYYLKESAYYDQANSSLHVKVQALCPIMMDEFGGEATQYPLFWVKYSELEPYLNRQTVMASSMNNAATVSMDDFFTLNMYRGKIYKTNNAQGKTLLQLCDGDETKVAAEQKRIEAELAGFKKTIFGDPAKRDSLDSVAAQKDTKAGKKVKAAKNKPTTTKGVKVAKQKSPKAEKTSSNSGARVSVRRQRH
jgi:gliding motility associated protien GldN